MLNETDPADMTTAELLATWTDTDPESAPHPAPHEIQVQHFRAQGYYQDVNGVWRRPFGYSTRGANAGPSPKYRKSAPEVYGGRTLTELCKPTKADLAEWGKRPLLIHPKRAQLKPYFARAASRRHKSQWLISPVESVAFYRERVAKMRAKLEANRYTYGLYITPETRQQWAEPVAPTPEPAVTYLPGGMERAS